MANFCVRRVPSLWELHVLIFCRGVTRPPWTATSAWRPRWFWRRGGTWRRSVPCHPGGNFSPRPCMSSPICFRGRGGWSRENSILRCLQEYVLLSVSPKLSYSDLLINIPNPRHPFLADAKRVDTLVAAGLALAVVTYLWVRNRRNRSWSNRTWIGKPFLHNVTVLSIVLGEWSKIKKSQSG